SDDARPGVRMKSLLGSSTDTAAHLLCDPGAMFHLTQLDYDSWCQRFAEEARDHNGLLVVAGGDGDCRMLVVVDEAVDAELEEYAALRRRGQLFVPTGRLVAW